MLGQHRRDLVDRSFSSGEALTVDEGFAMLGTASFDIRSFHLNVELNLVWSDVDLSGLMRFYHTKCIQESKKLDLTDWGSSGRSVGSSGAENLGKSSVLLKIEWLFLRFRGLQTGIRRNCLHSKHL